MTQPNDRRDDWAHGVDENLASLNIGQRVTDRLLEDIELQLADLDKVIRGDTELETSGHVGRIHNLETQVAELRAVVIMDASGNRGLQHDVEELKTGERHSEYRWKFFTSVVVAIISLLGLLITNWSKLEKYLNKRSVDPLESAISKAVHPKAKHRHYTIREDSSDEQDE